MDKIKFDIIIKIQEVGDMEQFENFEVNTEDKKEVGEKSITDELKEILEDFKEAEVDKTREVEIIKEIKKAKAELEKNKTELLKYNDEYEKLRNKMLIRKNNISFLNNKIQSLVLEIKGIKLPL